MTVMGAGFGCAYMAIETASWIPIFAFVIISLLLEGLYWWDLIYGWPFKKIK
jgi:hypothetical protein